MQSTPVCLDSSCLSCPTINCEFPECDEIVCCCIRVSVMSSPDVT